MNDLFAQAHAIDTEDMTEDTGGGFEYVPPAEGPTPARLVGYVEIGKRHQKPFEGQPKPDVLKAWTFWELYGKHSKEITVDGVTKTIHPVIRVQIDVKKGPKSNYGKMLSSMAYGRSEITHMSHCLGETFIITLFHGHNAQNPKRPWINLRPKNGAFAIAAPVNPMDGTPLQLPAMASSGRFLLWDQPTKQMWDSIFIDGTRKKKVKDEAGNETEIEVSKNWMQEVILNEATDFSGSALEALLMTTTLPPLTGGEPASEPTSPSEDTTPPAEGDTSEGKPSNSSQPAQTVETSTPDTSSTTAGTAYTASSPSEGSEDAAQAALKALGLA